MITEHRLNVWTISECFEYAKICYWQASQRTDEKQKASWLREANILWAVAHAKKLGTYRPKIQETDQMRWY